MSDSHDLFDSSWRSRKSQALSSSRKRNRSLTTSWTKAQATKLALLIEAEEQLWNNFHPEYKNFKASRLVWDKIAEQLERKTDDCVNKWGSMRSNFKARCVDKTKNGGELPTPEDIPEPYCHMGFLMDVIQRKPSTNEATITKQKERKSDNSVNKWSSLRSNFKARHMKKRRCGGEVQSPEDNSEPYCHMGFLMDEKEEKLALSESSTANEATHAVERKSEDTQIETMDCEGLISQISINPPLWNKKCEDYCNRIVTEKIWDAISIHLKATKENCKKKWKLLKGEYWKALHNVPQKASGSASEPNSSRFKYDKLMVFLKDDVNFNGEGNIECPLESFSIDESTSISLISNDDIMDNNNFEKVPQSYKLPINKQRRKNSTDELNDEYVEIENKKPKLLEKDKDKDCVDLHFFKSLIPFVKDIPLIEKLEMRGEIQAVVLKYLHITSFRK